MRIHVHGVRRYVPTASKGKKGLKVVLPQLWIYPKGETTGEMLCDQMKHPKFCTFFDSPLSTQKKTLAMALFSFYPFFHLEFAEYDQDQTLLIIFHEVFRQKMIWVYIAFPASQPKRSSFHFWTPCFPHLHFPRFHKMCSAFRWIF